MDSENRDATGHWSPRFADFMQHLGGLQMLLCSEQALEGRHATMAKEVKHAPHHSGSLLSVNARFDTFEAWIESHPEDRRLTSFRNTAAAETHKLLETVGPRSSGTLLRATLLS